MNTNDLEVYRCKHYLNRTTKQTLTLAVAVFQDADGTIRSAMVYDLLQINVGNPTVIDVFCSLYCGLLLLWSILGQKTRRADDDPQVFPRSPVDLLLVGIGHQEDEPQGSRGLFFNEGLETCRFSGLHFFVISLYHIIIIHDSSLF